MRGGGKSSGGGSSVKSSWKAAKEKLKQSGKDSDESVARQKKRTHQSRENSCAKSCREEVECLLSETAPKKSAPNPPEKPAPPPPRTTAAERQRVMEAEAAQKIVDDRKEKEQLEAENKRLKALLEKANNVSDPVPESPRPNSATKPRVSNSVRRVKGVYFEFHFIIFNLCCASQL